MCLGGILSSIFLKNKTDRMLDTTNIIKYWLKKTLQKRHHNSWSFQTRKTDGNYKFALSLSGNLDGNVHNKLSIGELAQHTKLWLYCILNCTIYSVNIVLYSLVSQHWPFPETELVPCFPFFSNGKQLYVIKMIQNSLRYRCEWWKYSSEYNQKF